MNNLITDNVNRNPEPYNRNERVATTTLSFNPNNSEHKPTESIFYICFNSTKKKNYELFK